MNFLEVMGAIFILMIGVVLLSFAEFVYESLKERKGDEASWDDQLNN